jgi:AcrR family transcriptional regulator
LARTKRRSTYHHGDLRAALIAAALRAIAEHGPDGFTLRAVARRAGVSPAAPYRHFDNKDELLAAVAAECADRIAAAVTGATAEVGPDPIAAFRAVGIAVVQFAAAHPEHFRALAIPGIADRMPAPQRAGRAEWDVAQRRALVAAQDAGLLTHLPVDDILLAASSLTHGLGMLIVQGYFGEVSAARARELAIAATEVLGLGLLPRPP